MTKTTFTGPIVLGPAGTTAVVTGNGIDIVSGDLLLESGNIVQTAGFQTLSASAITAGTTQTRAGATAITTSVVSVTVGNASDGVVLPAAVIGREITIVNVSNAAGKLYAAGSDTINLVAGATGVALTSGSTTGVVTFVVCASAGSWTSK